MENFWKLKNQAFLKKNLVWPVSYTGSHNARVFLQNDCLMRTAAHTNIIRNMMIPPSKIQKLSNISKMFCQFNFSIVP